MENTLRLLLIDDDDIDRMAIRRALRTTGLNILIKEVTNGTAALEVLKHQSFDCVLLDYLLPDADGLEILRSTRIAGNTVPVIMLTGHGDEHIAVKLIRAGASDYLSKERLSSAALSCSLHTAIRMHRTQLERKQVEAALQRTHEEMIDILESISDAFFAVDKDGLFSYLNKQAEALLAESREALLGQSVWNVLPESAEWLRDALKQVMKARSAMHLEGELTSPDNIWLDCHIYPRQEGLSLYCRDVTERKRAEAHLSYLANHDVLTNLPNRALFMDRLEQALSRAPWRSRIVALMFFDLDRFKFVNDSLGHAAGDQLLKLVAQRLSDCMREGDTVARLGGDEFVVTLVDIADAEDIHKIAQKFLKAFVQPFNIDGRDLFVTPSIGVSIFPNDGDDAGNLMRNADIAMYRAKDLGGNHYAIYAHGMSAQARTRLALEAELRCALERRQLRLYYQPLLDLNSQAIVGAEALLRWQHSELGIVEPLEFIWLAEENGLIVSMGEWVLRTACEQVKAWQAAGLPPISIAVNLSNRQFRQANLLEVVQQTLEATDLAPNQLELELTENIITRNADNAIQTLHKLRQLGIKLSIDDFGTGYSSLGYLKRLPLDALKIDMSFVEDITTSADNAAITGAIIAMAHKMNLTVVAEGVETEAQRDFLLRQGCDRFQGYLVSPPIPAEKFAQLLLTNDSKTQAAC
ncbi:MAG: EAL domain-containing protein [Cyanothece sp. SIO1E1]|nr:EAL domain-containing protein [Cyanothece sp. SIO1E1]